ncbi:MAG: hypothetical protein PHX27_04775 [Candidatus ainarchaeum sp.]|nr:hypothetical protein [Candidatus ainarchaeum sp.]
MREENIVETKPVMLCEVREVLEAKKTEKELNYEQELTMKYVEKFSKLTKKQSEELFNFLKEISFLKENVELIYQIIYTLPTSIEQVKLFVPKDVEATDDELKQVVAQTIKFGEKI